MFKLFKRSETESNGGAHGDGKHLETTVDHPQDLQEKSQPIKYDVVVSLLSDVGCQREINEDSIRFIQPGDPDVLGEKGVLVLVADGMGGHSGGEVASGMAIDVISRVYYQESGETQALLSRAFKQASREIYSVSEKDEGLKGMGTTCTALVLKNGAAHSAHVGDSRLYLVRDGQIYVMTEDHSEVMEMVKRGLISLEEARHHPDKNVILRAIGSHEEVEVSTWDEPFPIREGDSFLLCSDGLYDLVEDDEIRRAVEKSDPQTACEGLVALAKERGGHDNISVGIVSLLPVAEAQSKPLRQTREVEAGI
ncbi:MAG: Stp1/IreP family PP2C-type Ser/Thr phosphatase [Blastocatellia bacterium]